MPAALRRLRAALRPLQLGVQRTPRRALAGGSQERGELLAPATLGVHADAQGPPRDGGGASGEPRLWSHDRDIAPPIGVTTTFEAAGDDGHVYSRQSTPTRDRCESVLAALEATPGSAAPHALLYSSGLAACHAILVALAPSAARLAISGGYHGTHQVIDILTELRTELEIIELPAAQEAAAVLRSGDIVWLESPRNPMCEVYDIAAYSSLSCKPAVVVDGTFAPPPVQRALSHGATAVMHSTTKYLSGHSDAVGGALCVEDDELAERLHAQRTAMGSVPGSLEVWLLLRSLRTLSLRLERHCSSATVIATWLDESVADAEHPLHGLVRRVWHPSLPSHPGHDVATRQMAPRLFGGVLSVELHSEAAARALTSQLQLFGDATSLGGVESLVEWRRQYDDSISPYLLRLSIGLEDPEDLKRDLLRGLLETSALTDN